MERLVSTLVLIHAFPLDHRMFDEVADEVAQSGWQVILPDLRGCGGASDFEGEPSLDVCADDIVRILDRLGVERAVVGGCSLGGYVTLALLRRYPERVAGVILIDTKAAADSEEARANRLRMAEIVTKAGSTEPLWSAMLPNALGRTTQDQRPAVVELARSIMADSNPTGIANLQLAMASRVDGHQALREAKVPVLSIRGDEDTITSADDHARMATAAREAIEVELPGVGHLAPLEAPKEVSAAIVDFLGKLKKPSC